MSNILLQLFSNGVEIFSLTFSIIGGVIIAGGAFFALVSLIKGLLSNRPNNKSFTYTYLDPLRIEFGRYINLGLEFLIAKDVIETMFLPTWTDIGQLFALVVIRTLISYFLMHEIKSIGDRK